MSRGNFGRDCLSRLLSQKPQVSTVVAWHGDFAFALFPLALSHDPPSRTLDSPSATEGENTAKLPGLPRPTFAAIAIANRSRTSQLARTCELANAKRREEKKENRWKTSASFPPSLTETPALPPPPPPPPSVSFRRLPDEVIRERRETLPVRASE